MSLQEIRRDKLHQLEERGIPAYAYRYDVTHRSGRIRADHEALETSGATVRVAGRLMTKRGHGRASFAHIKDQDGLLQVYLREDALGPEAYAAALELDLGDWVGIEGSVFRTKTGEITVMSGRWVPPLNGLFSATTSPGFSVPRRWVSTVRTLSPMAPRCTGTCGAFAGARSR